MNINQARSSRNCRLTALVLAGALYSGALAGTTVLLPEIQRLGLPVNGYYMPLCESNPATMLLRDSVSLSGFVAGVDFDRQEKPETVQKGDGHNLFGLSADTYTRLGDDCVVWGEAAFLTGCYSSVRWSDCIDYDRVAPYVLGDEVGGDLSTRSYRFAGGYARSFERWSVGAEASYRAEVAYRNRDPRVKTVVSDLDISLGAGLNVGANNLVGLKAGFNIYNQNCDIDFYNPLNEINTYPLTGLETYYNRFVGNANKSSGHSSFGYNVGLQWLSLDRSGFSAAVGYSAYRMDQSLRSFNNLTLGYTDNSTIDWAVVYRWTISRRLILQPRLDGVLSKRRGTENIFGSAAGSGYDKIGSRTPYTYDSRLFRFTLPVQISTGGRTSFLTLAPAVTFESDDECYTDPQRQISATRLTPGLKADYSALTARSWLWECSLGISYSKIGDKKIILTDLDLSSPLGMAVMSNGSMLTSDRREIAASAGISHQLKSLVLSLSVAYRLTDFIGNGLCHGAQLTLSAKF